MIKKISCKVIESSPINGNKTELICVSCQNTKDDDRIPQSLNAKAKLHYKEDGTWHSFNCRL